MSASDFGELEFKRRRVTGFSLTFLLGSAALTGIAMLAPGVTQAQERGALCVALVLAAIFAWHVNSVAEFWEGGVRCRSPRHATELKWSDVATFSLNPVSFPVDGFLIILSTEDGRRLSIRTRHAPDDDPELMGVISALALAESMRMKATLGQGGFVPLGPHARLTATGLEVIGASFGQGGAARLVGWDRLAGERPDFGGVSFLAEGESRPFLRVFKSTPGLLPALQVVRERAKQAQDHATT